MFFCLFLVFHNSSERGRKELGTVRLLRSKGEGGGREFRKVWCMKPLPPLPPQKKILYMKILQPPWQ